MILIILFTYFKKFYENEPMQKAVRVISGMVGNPQETLYTVILTFLHNPA